MNDLITPLLAAALGMAMGGSILYAWVRHLVRARAHAQRTRGYALINELRAYSAWIDQQRDLPLDSTSLDELTSPDPLSRARAIRRDFFPSLEEPMVLLLQAHSRLIEYLWEQNLLRLSQGAGWVPAHRDVRYQQLRGAQEDLIDDMTEACREAIGDARQWRATGSDFSFTHSQGMSTQGPGTQL